jgi:DNA-binding GntR family transcriptional regulator
LGIKESVGKGSWGRKAHLILREAIATGRLKPGARVLGWSRTPVREATAAHDPATAEAAVRDHIRNTQQVRIKLLLQTGEASF